MWQASGWGVAGAAIATVIAQSFSAVYCFLILRRIDIVHLSRADFMTAAGMNATSDEAWYSCCISEYHYRCRRSGSPVRDQWLWLSFLWQDLQLQTSFMVCWKWQRFPMDMPSLLMWARIWGAGKIDRIVEGVRSGMLLSLLTSLIISIAMFLFGKISSHFSSQVNRSRQRRYFAIAFKSPFYYGCHALGVVLPVCVQICTAQGLGDTLMPMVSGMAEFVMRISAALILPHFIGQDGIFFAEIAAWSGATVILCISYLCADA
ncbi:MAG: hypothetical protein ACLTER_19980 [Ruminococcus sp.]